ncbi:guanitoxin biosynthesis heme-dependent pre-guanitoxin N-hydroxylase GntA [Aquabacterium sp.]|uniref:guanitoxin biosynthesis heme-dependent pre-guanitoxin N-hydroxylase GntA n=1 Tax=Aquabacterium sp. TaxID=1872578 RepID=UPI00248870F8|nr:guanitoxin biosynthesis heme-dependent pre-guanitoxin N-hydroxylase GntA [Aquabacterium sp.]MDI1257676.1 guanitoxin biosynthesis heme-dependent pre-guanitoxin N-hydroxylase GntA [Aquabacterium sp.]
MSQRTSPQRSDAPSWAAQLRPWNPLHDDGQASRLSSYLAEVDGQLAPVLDPHRGCDHEEIRIHQQLKSKVLDDGFPCVVARSAINRKTYRLGVYGTLGTADAALAICHDLYEFSHEMQGEDTEFSTFIATFQQPATPAEVEFETLLWHQLQLMHGVDARYFPWDASVSKDPEDPDFSFSIGGQAFFVVGMHPLASRLARQAPSPCIVFNPHAQFEQLRATGRYDKLQKAIRQRDMAYQGSINPVLANFGHEAESRQYSGRAISGGWKCPFHAQPQQP